MKSISKILMLMLALTTPFLASASDKTPKSLEQVMEISNAEQLLTTILELEKKENTQTNKAKLGILYHDAALKGIEVQGLDHSELIEKSYTKLTSLMKEKEIDAGLRSVVAAYQASALAQLGAERENTKMMEQAFILFEQAERHYGQVEFVLPYLRSKAAELLPYGNIYKSIAKKDLAYMIDRYGLNKDFATPSVMSYVYYSWSKSHKAKRFRGQAVRYLEKSIELAPQGTTAKRATYLLEDWRVASKK